MAITIDYDSLEDDHLNYIKTLVIPFEEGYSSKMYKYFSEKNEVALPLGQWRDFYDEFPEEDKRKVDIGFVGNLYTLESDPKHTRDQSSVADQALKILKKDHSVFLHLPTGFGKTRLAVYLSSILGLVTGILSHNDQIKLQWEEEYRESTTSKVQRVTRPEMNPTADVYIMGILQASKPSFPRELTRKIGTLIVDEAHLVKDQCLMSTLFKFTPTYLILLTATPDKDGIVDPRFFFYVKEKNFISRFVQKTFTVIKYKTHFKPKIEYIFTRNGRQLNWSTVLNSLAYNTSRQSLIVNLAAQHADKHKILVLSGRQEECKNIHKGLLEKKIKAELLIGDQRHWDRECRVLIAGIKKAGVGFNDPTLTMLILATDCTDVRQFEGRIRTEGNIVYDIVDDYSCLENHWEARKEWYICRGATITANLTYEAKMNIKAKEVGQRTRSILKTHGSTKPKLQPHPHQSQQPLPTSLHQ